MYTLVRTLVAVLFLALGGMTTAGAQTTAEVNKTLDELFGEHAPYQQFFEKLKKAVAEDDRQTVALMVDYPFQARIKGRAVKIRDRKHFSADYDEIITPKVKNAISRQSYATLFANWQGVMIGDGEIWFSGICKDDECREQTIKIIAIND